MLALICGQGALPTRIVQNCSVRPLIASLAQFQPDELVPDINFRLETLGTLLDLLNQRDVTKVCFAGGIRRPDINPTLIDESTQPLAASISEALAKGDDGALRVMIEIFEQAGFDIIGADDIVPDLLPAVGVLTRRLPTLQDHKDATRGAEVIASISNLDLGQACAIVNGQVLAMEAYGGTDWMLNSLTPRVSSWPLGGVLFKAPKITQDRRFDLPCIGLETCQQVKDAGLSGIVIAHAGVLVLDVEDVIAEADRLNLFIWVCEAPL